LNINQVIGSEAMFAYIT